MKSFARNLTRLDEGHAEELPDHSIEDVDANILTQGLYEDKLCQDTDRESSDDEDESDILSD